MRDRHQAGLGLRVARYDAGTVARTEHNNVVASFGPGLTVRGEDSPAHRHVKPTWETADGPTTRPRHPALLLRRDSPGARVARFPHMLHAAVSLALLAGCPNESTGPSTFGVIRITIASACVTTERVQVWIDDTDHGQRTLSTDSPWPIPNIQTGHHEVAVFRFRYSSEHVLTSVRVATGGETQLRLDCPDGVTVTQP